MVSKAATATALAASPSTVTTGTSVHLDRNDFLGEQQCGRRNGNGDIL